MPKTKPITPRSRLSLLQIRSIVAVVLLILLSIVVWFSLRGASPTHNQLQTSSSVSPTASSSPSNPPSASTTSPPTSPAVTSAPTPATSLPTPTGQVLNKPEVHLSESDPGTQYGSGMDSTCQTIAGASCGIELTSSTGQVKTVAAKQVVAMNGTYGVDLTWDVKVLNLSVGTWSARAVATKDGQTAKSNAWPLTVTQ